MSEPPMCTLKELQDGTYSIDDLADMHEAVGLKSEVNRILAAQAKQRAGKK